MAGVTTIGAKSAAKPKADSTEIPSGLGVEGTALWHSIADKYNLRPDELAWLEIACRARDMAAAWEEVWLGVVSRGDQITYNTRGDAVAHPASKELASHRRQAQQALKELQLGRVDPGPAGGARGPMTLSEHQRKAGMARAASRKASSGNP